MFDKNVALLKCVLTNQKYFMTNCDFYLIKKIVTKELPINYVYISMFFVLIYFNTEAQKYRGFDNQVKRKYYLWTLPYWKRKISCWKNNLLLFRTLVTTHPHSGLHHQVDYSCTTHQKKGAKRYSPLFLIT